MIKRKFSFNLTPAVKPSAKPDAHVKPTTMPDPAPPSSAQSRSHSHRRQFSKDSLSSANSALINRRPLSPKTEQELRAACSLILQNFKPSDHGYSDLDPKLDFKGMNRHREHRENRNDSHQVKVRRPTGAPAESSRRPHDARKERHTVESSTKQYTDPPTQANTGRRRAEPAETSERDREVSGRVKSPASDPSRSSGARTDMDSDDAKSVGTPLTGSTDAHMHTASTAPTSAALTSGRSSKRTSRQFESPAALADAQAAEWMKQELQKRRQQQAAHPEPQPEQSPPARPPSRAKSIKSGIKEYMFPGSTNLSRQQSSESLRTMNSMSSQSQSQKASDSNGPSRGWRSWNWGNRSSSRSSSRPGTSKGRTDTQEQDKKAELNLNRELPPLPSLDSWNKQGQTEPPPPQKEKRVSQAPGHIAAVMRTQDDQRKEYAAAVRQHHRRSGSDTLALKYANSSFAQSSPHIARTASSAKALTTAQPARTASGLDSSMDFDRLMSSMDSSSSRNLDDALKLKNPSQPQIPGHVRNHSASTVSRSGSMKMSIDGNGRLAAPNFSRKISADMSSPRTIDSNYRYQNTMKIATSPGSNKEEHKSRLKKVFSGWMLRKKNENWMDQFEKNGIKTGVMTQDEPAAAPVIRY